MLARKIVVALCLFAPAAFGITLGELQVGGALHSTGIPGSPLTLIATSRPALAAGTVNSVTLRWIGAPPTGCSNAVKIKFFRTGTSGTLQVIASHGPFNVQNGINTFAVLAVAVNAGDWIGVTQLSNTCGGIAQAYADRSHIVGVTFTDPTPTATGVNYSTGRLLNIVATTDAEYVYGYFIVVGSLRGSFGSDFKTSAQLANVSNSTITGKLVFHSAGVPTQASDPSINYSIPAFRTVSYNDVVQAIGATGLGTMDLVITSGYPPDVTMRIYNDEGAVNGTSGLTEELLTPFQAHNLFESGSLTIPTDLTAFRLNIGYRTLTAGARMFITVFDANGSFVDSTERDFPPNTFNQDSAAGFAQTTGLPPGGRITFQITAGSAFVYGAVTDNRTNDPNLRFAPKF